MTDCKCGAKIIQSASGRERFYCPSCKLENIHARSRKWKREHAGHCKDYQKMWRIDNMEHLKISEKKRRERNPEYQKLWRKENIIRCRANEKKWRDAHPDIVKRNRQKNPEKRRAADLLRYQNPNHKLSICLRVLTRRALKGGLKSAHTLQLLGCTVPEAWAHLESKFVPGMTRENHGKIWHIDHKRPCSSFDLTDPAQQRECFHFSNLQPLFAFDNLSKGAKYA